MGKIMWKASHTKAIAFARSNHFGINKRKRMDIGSIHRKFHDGNCREFTEPEIFGIGKRKRVLGNL